MRSNSIGWHLLLTLFGAFLINAPDACCAEAQVEIYFKRLVVAPALVGHHLPNLDESLDDTLQCPINQICDADPAINPAAGPMMMRLIHSVLKNRFGSNVVPLADVQNAYTDLRLDDNQDTPRTLARRLGQSLSADLMMISTVWRYRDRDAVGGLTDKPTSVGFALYLVEPETGRRLWRGVFDKNQDYAFKDMARFTDRMKMGFKWLTADELARFGVEQTLRRFPEFVIAVPPDTP